MAGAMEMHQNESAASASGTGRVLSQGFALGLAQVNQVLRELRRLGWRVARQAVSVQANQPHCVLVVPASAAAQPLQQLTGGCSARQQADGSQLCSTLYRGVRVQWAAQPQGGGQ